MDQGLRDAERRWSEGGRASDGLRLLRELVRAQAPARRLGEVRTAVAAALLTEGGHRVRDPRPWPELAGGGVLTVPGEAAVAAWELLRPVADELGAWPLLLGHEELHEESLTERRATPARLLELADELGTPDPAAWARIRTEGLVHRLTNEGLHDLAATLAQSLTDEREPTDEGEWPEEGRSAHRFAIPRDVLSQAFHRQLFLGLVPTRRGWEVPAWIAFGGWNDCPAPQEHCAIFRHWEQRYGAEPVGITRDVVELKVTRPPATREAALELARVQYAYCSDIVDQGCETVANLAAGLLDAPGWFFWWD